MYNEAYQPEVGDFSGIFGFSSTVHFETLLIAVAQDDRMGINFVDGGIAPQAPTTVTGQINLETQPTLYHRKNLSKAIWASISH